MDTRTQEIIQATVEAVLDNVEYDDHLAKLVEKHERALYGSNGDEGLLAVSARLERVVNGIEGIGRRVLEVLVVAGVIGVLVLIVQNNLIP